MWKNGEVMGIKKKLEGIRFIKNYLIEKEFGDNIHDMGLNESIESGIVERLLNARKINIDYCVVFGNIVPMNSNWDKYGNGTWNPSRDYITTNDIKTPDNDLEQEKKNIYAFLRGESLEIKNQKTK